MVEIRNIDGNPNLEKRAQLGAFTIYEHKRDLSNDPATAQASFFMQSMNFRKRQLLAYNLA